MPPVFSGRAPRTVPRSIEVLLLATTLVGCSVEAPGTGPQTDTGGSVMEDPPAAVVDSGSVEVGEDAQVGPADTLDADVDSSVADSSAPAPDAGSVLPTVDAAQAQDAALMDAQDALVTDADGSQEDAAQDAGPVVDATPGQDAGPRCTLDGSFAAEVNFAVQWKGTTLGGVIPVLAAGTGHLRIMVRIDAQQTGAQPSWKLTACGAVIPDFAASWLIGEVYSVEIPAKAWDQPTNPGWPLQWNLDCNGPGCGLRSAPFLATLGARYQAPTDWPGASGPLSQIVSVDHDSDMHPGITLRARGPREQNPAGKAYDLPPVSWNLGARATTIYTALQIATRIEGALDSCDAFKGTLHDGRVEARALGCTARKDGEPRDEPCTTPQATFVDTNFPNWVVTGGTLRAKRIAPESTCAGVRAALQ